MELLDGTKECARCHIVLPVVSFPLAGCRNGRQRRRRECRVCYRQTKKELRARERSTLDADAAAPVPSAGSGAVLADSLNVGCPVCAGPLEHVNATPPSVWHRAFVLSCPPCGQTWVLDLRMGAA